MARSFNGSSQYLRNASFPAVTYPLTISCRFKPAANPAGAGDTYVLVSLAKSAGLEEFWIDYYNEGAGVYSVRAVTQDAATGARTRDYPLTLTAGQWYTITGVFTNSTTIDIYVDGVAGGSYTGTGTPSPVITDLFVGALIYNTSNVYGLTNGDLAEVAVWDTALLAGGGVAALADGMSPQLIRPESLVAYAPLIGRASPEIETVGGADLTLTGSPAVASHPRIFRAPRLHIGYDNPAVGGAFKPAWARNSNQIIGAWQ